MEQKHQFTKLGIVGGGQLAKMLASVCKINEVHLTILDPEPDPPARQMAVCHIIGDFHDEESLRKLCAASDVVTFDLEDVGADILITLGKTDVRIVPFPEIIELIQNKLKQKQHYSKHGLPTAEYKVLDQDAIFESVETFGLPCVQKTHTGGYDGHGVYLIRSESDWEGRLPSDSFVEAFIENCVELAVMVVCGADGEIVSYDPVELIVNSKLHRLEYLLAPARVTDEVAEKARELAIKTVSSFKSPGLFGVELFLDQDGHLFINEVAPRAHNSGHHTIEACSTCQFENQLRTCLNLKLGDTTLSAKALTMNLLGESGFSGPCVIEGLNHFNQLQDAYIHLYGKSECRPGRKMGHVTLLGTDYDELLAKADYVKSILRVRGEAKI